MGFLRTSTAEYQCNLKVATAFKEYDSDFYRNAFDEPKSVRCGVRCSPCVVQAIPFIGAARSQLSGEFRGVLSISKLMQSP